MANQYTKPVRQLLREWLEWNPNGWLIYTLDEIAEKIGASRSSVYDWIDIILAEIHEEDIGGVSLQTFSRIRMLQRTVTDRTRKDVAQRLKEGYDIYQTSYYFGLHPWNVHVIERSLKDKDAGSA